MPTFQLLYKSLSLLKNMSSLMATSVILYDWAVQPQLLARICPCQRASSKLECLRVSVLFRVLHASRLTSGAAPR